ncbi:NAD(+)--dinitrogen-reductase ADP-D-ribosyltransferase [Rhodovulum sp. P5]|uniref:NAD(+)--dinitrogen-reductase ADP-D-ribosyltransferase n=1 Tax=Rhodovulum sp. P5 TaxID=1564506 RepID=UPI0009C29F95|nr:NAD(+)--dinitrogen-reductase ADP-D-ribosyltransferase [Rhodovulum sp. P5]ARE39944.1 NAD(+)--dinitrogen-reductase ADP-D-ribosyltransferase [Rhodovulum sp. P5]
MAAMKDAGHSSGHSIRHATNLVGRSADWLGSTGFNETSDPLHIWGVTEMNRSLFAMLEGADDLTEAGEAFRAYMTGMFAPDPEQQANTGSKHYRASFLRLIQGWGFDSNGPEGAVLKGWVESRFGVCPSYHKDIIDGPAGPAWTGYVEEKMSSRFHNNAIWVQLDLLFEFCQWAIRRFAFPGQTHLTLYRGVNDVDRHRIVERTGRRAAVIRLNNLVSFSADRDVAGCFGDRILTTRVPLAKIVFFNGLLPTKLLHGEREFLAIGGDYRVTMDYV